MTIKIKKSSLKNIDFEHVDKNKKIFLCKLCENEITENVEGLCNACIEQMNEQKRDCSSLENILVVFDY